MRQKILLLCLSFCLVISQHEATAAMADKHTINEEQKELRLREIDMRVREIRTVDKSQLTIEESAH